jgi:AcrR family transcriptional regulator
MTGVTPRVPQRSHARNNRVRILAAARQELARDPDASIEDIAKAAGVVRRTLYGHFANRQALVAALADEATKALQEAFIAALHPGDDPVTAMARMSLASWAVGDRYRMLISLGRRDLGEEGIRAVLAPARAEAAAILHSGQEAGVFATHLKAPILAQAIEAMLLILIEINASDPSGEAAATAALIAAGVPPAEAARHTRAVLAERT